MEDKTRNALLLGAGFLMGTVGIKALTSPRAKRVYVQGVAKGLQAKAYYEDVVEQAKAEVDDMMAEATYINAVVEDEKAERAQVVEVGSVDVAAAQK